MVRKPWVVLFSYLILGVLSAFCCSSVFALGSGGYRNEVVDAEAAGKGFSFTGSIRRGSLRAVGHLDFAMFLEVQT